MWKHTLREEILAGRNFGGLGKKLKLAGINNDGLQKYYNVELKYLGQTNICRQEFGYELNRKL